MLILTYNIRAALGIDGTRSTERIADVIRDCGAEIACLQEVDQRMLRSRFIDQPKRLGELLGMSYVFQPNLLLGPGRFGNLILTRYPIIESQSFALTSDREQRGLLMAKIESPEGTINLFCTHWGLSSDERAQQSTETSAILNSFPEPKILCGDFNDYDYSPAVTGLISSAGLHDLAVEAGLTEPTFPSDQPKARIDFIFGTNTVQSTSAAVLDTPASDHRPVIVDLHIS